MLVLHRLHGEVVAADSALVGAFMAVLVVLSFITFSCSNRRCNVQARLVVPAECRGPAEQKVEEAAKYEARFAVCLTEYADGDELWRLVGARILGQGWPRASRRHTVTSGTTRRTSEPACCQTPRPYQRRRV